MQRMKHVRMLMHLHGPVVSDKPDIRALAACDAAGNRAADVLWYGLASFLQGYNGPSSQCLCELPDMESPIFLAQGVRPEVSAPREGAGGLWQGRRHRKVTCICANSTTAGSLSIRRPRRRMACQFQAAAPGCSPTITFEYPEKLPLVEKFDLPVHRGIILLKPGKKSGGALAVRQCCVLLTGFKLHRGALWRVRLIRLLRHPAPALFSRKFPMESVLTRRAAR